MIPRQFSLEVLAINRAIASAEDYEDVLRQVVDRTAAFTGAAACLLLLSQGDGFARVVRSVGIEPAKAARLAVPLTERIDAELCSHLGFQGRDLFIGVPVIGNEGLMGILAVCWEEPHADGAIDVGLISAFADQAAIALANIERVRRLQAAAEALQASEARLAGIISTAADAIISADEAQRIVMYNEAARTVFGWSKEEVVGKPFDVLLPERFRATHAQHVRTFGGGPETARKMGARSRMLFGLRKSGEEFPVDAAISKLNVGGAWQFTAVVRDITERERAEQALRASEAKLAEANRKKDEFLAMLAHELRNPLAPMRLAAENIIAADSADAIVNLGAAVIGRQVTHLSRLVDDLLDVSRISHGMIEVRKKRMALADVVGAAVEISRPSIEERQQHLAVVQEHPGIYLDGDADRLAQVLCNLLNNAAKFTSKGGEITLTTRIEGDGAAVSVRDSGRGIPADLLPRVFELFFQAEAGRGRGRGGMGIGLALARRLVELHGGSLEANSNGEGKGSEFVVRLPRQAEAPSRPNAVPPAGAEPAAPASYRVLVVDDNVDAAKMTQVFLQARGHDVRCAFDGLSALGLAQEFKPQLVLLDIAMPGMDGYEVLSRLRKQSGAPRAVVAALTGYASEAGMERLKQLGLDRYLVKPAAPQALLALIASLAVPQDMRTA
jgi:PAS domain S-box-containing protein